MISIDQAIAADAEACSKPHHLITAVSQGKPICGEASPNAAVGSYVEHIDTANGAVQWVREVFDRDGRPVAGCAACLALYPTVLL